MLQGFFIGVGAAIGFILALFLLIVLIGLFKKSRRKPTVRMWRAYLKVQIDLQDFAEAEFVRKLISGKNDDETTSLPKGYTIGESSDPVFDEKDDGKVSFHMHKKRWIIKVKPHK